MARHQIAEAAAAYRVAPDDAHAEALREAMRGLRLLIPVGEFDGRNAELTYIHPSEGGTFIPLFTEREAVPEGQAAEEVGPADWLHILSQLEGVDGFVVDPYGGANLSFNADFIESLLAGPAARAQDGESGEAGAAGEEAGKLGEEAAGEEAGSVLAADAVPEGTTIRIGEPASVPDSLREAMQAVSNAIGAPLWLLLAVPNQGQESYLMVADVADEWIDGGGADAINGVLEGFPDPGLPFDFVSRSNELGSFVKDREPHYLPEGAAAQTSGEDADRAEEVRESTGAKEARETVGSDEARQSAGLDGAQASAGTEAEAERPEEGEKRPDPEGSAGAEAAPPGGDATETGKREEPETDSESPEADSSGEGGASGVAETPDGGAEAGAAAGEEPAAAAGGESKVFEVKAEEAGPEPSREEPVVNFGTPSQSNPGVMPGAFAPKAHALQAKAQEAAVRAKDVGGKAAEQALEKAGELGAQARERIADARANSTDAKGFVKRLFGRK